MADFTITTTSSNTWLEARFNNQAQAEQIAAQFPKAAGNLEVLNRVPLNTTKAPYTLLRLVTRKNLTGEKQLAAAIRTITKLGLTIEEITA